MLCPILMSYCLRLSSDNYLTFIIEKTSLRKYVLFLFKILFMNGRYSGFLYVHLHDTHNSIGQSHKQKNTHYHNLYTTTSFSFSFCIYLAILSAQSGLNFEDIIFFLIPPCPTLICMLFAVGQSDFLYICILFVF